MTPEIIDRDEFIVVGIRAVLEIGTRATDTLWRDRFLPRHNEIKGADHKYYNVFNALPGDTKGTRFECVAGVVGSLEDIPEGMVGWIIPHGKYAQVKTLGLAGISTACRDLLADWLVDSGFKWVDSPVFAYTEDKQPDSPGAEWIVNIPVETPEEIEQLKKWQVGADSE